MKLIEFIKNIKKREEIPSFDVKMILSYFYDIELPNLINFYDKEIEEKDLTELNNIIKIRLTGKPISKIFGKKCFWNYCFFVDENVLDPRPDSEIMIEEILKDYENFKNEKLQVLDLGTGSGCLIATILKLFENFCGTAIDISDKALNIAEKNSKNLGINNRLRLIKSNWNDSVEEKFDIIISNPPYIETNYIERLDIDVKNFDPILALDGGDDGLNPYRHLAKNLKKNCKHNTKIYLEIGINQKKPIIDLFETNNFKFIKSIKDYSNIDRILVFNSFYK